MIFKQWKQVVGLELPIKTQTRRPVGPRDEFDMMVCEEPFKDTVFRKGIVKWQVGRTYAVQRPDRKTMGRFELAKIWRERLQDISAEDCLAEGIISGTLETGGWCLCPICKGEFFTPERAFHHLWNIECGHLGTENEWLDGWAASDIAVKLPDVWVLEWPPVEGGPP